MNEVITLNGSQITEVRPNVYGGEVRDFDVVVAFKKHPHQLFRIDAEQASALICQALRRRKTLRAVKKLKYAYVQGAAKVQPK
jgi:microcystin degradation protein MlrC